MSGDELADAEIVEEPALGDREGLQIAKARTFVATCRGEGFSWREITRISLSVVYQVAKSYPIHREAVLESAVTSLANLRALYDQSDA
jgi:hypothetical protein